MRNLGLLGFPFGLWAQGNTGVESWGSMAPGLMAPLEDCYHYEGQGQGRFCTPWCHQ